MPPSSSDQRRAPRRQPAAQNEAKLLSFDYRWRHHLLFESWSEIIRVHQEGAVAIDPKFLVTNVAVLPMGAICGGFAVGAVRWLTDEVLFHYLPKWIVYLLGIGVVMGGPDALPPLTLINGCEDAVDRIIWTLLSLGWYYFFHYTSAYRFMMILSGLWHIDRGDYNNKKYQLICVRNLDHAMSEENIRNTLNFLILGYFRCAAGVGMLWAGFGVYSMAVFFKALLGYAGIQLFLYFTLGRAISEDVG